MEEKVANSTWRNQMDSTVQQTRKNLLSAKHSARPGNTRMNNSQSLPQRGCGQLVREGCKEDTPTWFGAAGGVGKGNLSKERRKGATKQDQQWLLTHTLHLLSCFLYFGSQEMQMSFFS